jgi:hypothetical protein
MTFQKHLGLMDYGGLMDFNGFFQKQLGMEKSSQLT